MAHMSDTFVLLQLEHRTILRLLDLVDAQLKLLREGDEADLELLELVLHYFRAYPDACHHPKEDIVFRRLELSHPEAAQQVGDLLGGHEALEQLTADVSELATRARGNGDERPDGLIEKLGEFIATYRFHLETEELSFFPLVSEKLGKDDWDLIDFEVFDVEDPIYDERAENRFLKLRELIFKKEGDQDTA